MGEIKEKTYNVYEVKGWVRVTIPKALTQGVGIGKGDKVKWTIVRGELVIRKAFVIEPFTPNSMRLKVK